MGMAGSMLRTRRGVLMRDGQQRGAGIFTHWFFGENTNGGGYRFPERAVLDSLTVIAVFTPASVSGTLTVKIYNNGTAGTDEVFSITQATNPANSLRIFTTTIVNSGKESFTATDDLLGSVAHDQATTAFTQLEIYVDYHFVV